MASGEWRDLAGLMIVATIAASALVASYEAIQRLLHPQALEYLGAVMVAAVIGFLGNEAVAVFPHPGGPADRQRRADRGRLPRRAWTAGRASPCWSGAIGVWAGYPLADPVVGLVISVAIFAIVWQSARLVWPARSTPWNPRSSTRLPMRRSRSERRGGLGGQGSVGRASLARRAARDGTGRFSVAAGHAIAKEVRHQLLHHLPHLGSVMVHVDPGARAAERHHRIGAHAHDGLPIHSHNE